MNWAESSVRALLISSSRVFGGGYLDHAEAAIHELLSGVRRILFVPHALADRDAYAEVARRRFEAMGFELDSLHTAADPRAAVEASEAAFVGGGNTFRLLKALNDLGILGSLRTRALEGMPYIGSSAGTNVACPTVRTTNDMPIVEPPSVVALGLVRFQVTPISSTGTRTRGTWGRRGRNGCCSTWRRTTSRWSACAKPRCSASRVAVLTLLETVSARIFRRGMAPLEVAPGARLNEHLGWHRRDGHKTHKAYM